MVTLFYISPGHFEGMLDNGYANFHSEERGGIDQYDFNVSFNFNDPGIFGIDARCLLRGL